MIIVRPTSLAATLDTVAEAFFFNKPIPPAQREEIALMLITRQIHTGSNSGFFIPFTAESETQFNLFSGEQLHSDFARSNIQLIEAARLLNLLMVDNYTVAQSIQVAEHRMETMCYSLFCPKGECKSLTITYMRYLTTSEVKDSGTRINFFLTKLAGHRDGKGKWNGFPFYYTLLMLSEVDDPLAIRELQYSATLCEKQLENIQAADPISKRRQAIITKGLARS